MSNLMVTDRPLYTGAADLERKVRSRDPETSWRAARISKRQQGEVKDFIVLILARRGPLTDDAIYRAYRASGGRRTPQRVRTARAELVNPKYGDPQVQLSAVVGLSEAGGPSQTWEVVPAGLTASEEDK